MNAMNLGGSHKAKPAARPAECSSPIRVGGNPLPTSVGAAKGFAIYDFTSDADSVQVCEAMASSCGDSEGCAGELAHPSPLSARGCSELLHEISNLMTGVLLNAQALEWKLPPYSHLKRPVREVTRSAQRGSELMKTLLCRCAEAERMPQLCGVSDDSVAATSDEFPAIGASVEVEFPVDLTAECDIRTSKRFPKRDDR